MRRLMLLMLALLFLLQAGCGDKTTPSPIGGSQGSGGDDGGVNSHLSGMAALGIIKNGNVRVYALNSDGSRGEILSSTTTDDRGNYSADIGTYSGPVIAYAYGSYLDEATGATVTLTESDAIRAALPQATGTVTLSITGLTDLAVKEADTLTPANIASANSLISSIFKVDITGTKPVDATPESMAGTTDKARVDYTLALAGLSQLASTSSGSTPAEKLQNALSTLSLGINGGINSQSAKAFANAVSAYLDLHGEINNIIISNGGSPVLTIGAQKAVVKLSFSGPAICGAQLVLTLPPGVGVKSQPDGSINNGVIGLTTPGAGLVAGKYTPPTGSSPGSISFVVVSTNAISNGTLIVNADLESGTTGISRDSFIISEVVLVDQDGAASPGTVTVTEVTMQ